MELLLLETFDWNLCMPTPAHFIDYYLHTAVQEGDLYNGWPLSSLSKTKVFMDKYTHYFLEVSLQGGLGGGCSVTNDLVVEFEIYILKKSIDLTLVSGFM